MFRSINPANEQLAAEFAPLDRTGIEHRLMAAAGAYTGWSTQSVAERSRVLTRAADLLAWDREVHARLLTEEMGKTIRAAREEVAKCERALRYYADNAADFLADTSVRADGRVSYQSLGVILAIMPWNFPYWQVVRFAAPALAAGNVALLKHASNVPRCALELEKLFRSAGAPAGVFQTLLIEVHDVAGVVADERVAAVTLTGSEGAGKSVARTAGENLKKCVLELGGSDPFIVLADADVPQAARVAAASRMINNGQSCIAAKRFVVERSIAEQFAELFVAAVRGLTVGDPMMEITDVGPLATGQIRREVTSQVERTIAAGARVLTGGRSGGGAGFFYEPTVLTDVPLHSPAANEEVFGPVAPVFVAEDPDHALMLANATRFGLGASVWTSSNPAAERFASALQAGTVALNGMVASDPRFPFGGIKKSGYGRELGVEGMREFLNIKTIRWETTRTLSTAQSE
jgi:succinate-semialdehyde dehydrogenase / glutarate-semialdehyde dehydrogenase